MLAANAGYSPSFLSVATVRSVWDLVYYLLTDEKPRAL